MTRTTRMHMRVAMVMTMRMRVAVAVCMTMVMRVAVPMKVRVNPEHECKREVDSQSDDAKDKHGRAVDGRRMQ